MIDFGATMPKRALTITDSAYYDKIYADIYQTFLFAHPFLYTYIAYPKGRLAWKHELMNISRETDMNFAENAIDNVIWASAVSCEKYAVAASTLFAQKLVYLMMFIIKLHLVDNLMIGHVKSSLWMTHQNLGQICKIF